VTNGGTALIVIFKDSYCNSESRAEFAEVTALRQPARHYRHSGSGKKGTIVAAIVFRNLVRSEKTISVSFGQWQNRASPW
jgi:hypothetical protein